MTTRIGGGDPPRRHCDAIASACLDAYAALPAKGAKPTRRSNNRLEWTILAGVVLAQRESGSEDDEHLVISLATGLKCLPYDRIPLTGDILHDCHAEVLARRAARRWLSHKLREELQRPTSQPDSASDTAATPCWATIFELNPITGRYRLREDITLHWYVSTLPCGDASTLLGDFHRARQDELAAKPGVLTPQALLDVHLDAPPLPEVRAAQWSLAEVAGPSRGRASTDRQDATRTKPGRPDSSPSICMSCSDKLALWCRIGIQGSLASSLLDPVRPSSIVVGDEAVQLVFPHDAQRADALRELLQQRCKRALWDRIDLTPSDGQAVEVGWTSIRFFDSRESVEATVHVELARSPAIAGGRWEDVEPQPSPNSLVYSPAIGSLPALSENLVGGIKMGAPSKRTSPSAPLRNTARSKLCKLEAFREWQTLVADTRQCLPTSLHLEEVSDAGTYHQAKHAVRSEWYRKLKSDLIGPRSRKDDGDGEVTNEVASDEGEEAITRFLAGARTSVRPDDDAEEEVAETLHGGKKEEPRAEVTRRPLGDWLVTPSRFDRFDVEGRYHAPQSADEGR